MIVTSTTAEVVYEGGAELRILGFHNLGPEDAYVLLGGREVSDTDYTAKLAAGEGLTFERHQGPVSAILAAGVPSQLVVTLTTHDGVTLE